MEGIDKVIDKIEKMKEELNDFTLEVLTRSEDGSLTVEEMEARLKKLKEDIKRLKKLKKQQEKMQDLLDEREEIVRSMEKATEKHIKKKHKKRH
ncbi:MAG: hypothetical protein N2594_01165 [Clostridiales bacterium]|nr:hypothetical protein [Clostridiales bacterium]